MNLVKEITKGLLEEEKKTVAVYGGGFKPPTAGHFEVVDQALKENTNIDEFIILIGGKERDGVTPEESLLIWDIYKQYLPITVEVKLSSKPPIQAVYNYAKEHPDEEVLFIIGAREGNEDDFSDIAKRTKSLDNYGNLELRTIVTQGGASGTAARNAAKVSSEKLRPLLPKEITDEEAEEIFGYISNVVKEEIVGNKIKCDKCGWSWNIIDGGNDLFMCHKCGHNNESKTELPPLLKEILDPTNFDFKPLIQSLTKSMENDGLKLKPYPKVKFIHTDFSNADDFFGKTAYYNPNNNEVVLYTLGRHPKDILRSYAHELIHVHQNHENRLENINTDNVNEDDYLEQIEREAYEEGNIAFRSWSNRITNQKDPFGLNAFAQDLAKLNEEEEQYYIYLDMDGVVADFDKRFNDLSGMMPQDYVNKNGLNAFWDLIDEKHKVAFWRGIELMPDAQKLVKFVEQYPFEMLTAPSIKKQSIIGKGLWVKDKIGTLYSTKPKVTYRSAKQKHTVKPNLTKFDILIDDKGSTIDNWNAAGGTGIFYQNANQVINDLKKLGL
jgi:5'(3')-deoxyribonucleotidase